MSDSGLFASGSYVGSSVSGVYRPRPSIARYIEASCSGVFSGSTQVSLRLDVLSDHQVYVDEQGAVRGVFVVTATPAPLGSPVNLDIQLPWGELLQVAGTVDWVLDIPKLSVRHRPGMGVRVEVDAMQSALLDRAMMLREPIHIPANAQRR